jgi:hypothetical protein
LLRQCQRPDIEPIILVPTDASGNEIGDIRTEAENVAFANDLSRLIKRLSDMPDNRIHVSMAGGRKTMSSYAQQAISLCGRDGDELSHILVDPPFLEYNRSFYWPGQHPKMINVSSEGSPVLFEAARAEIKLVPSPFVRLRRHLKQIPLARENFDHWTLVERVQASVDELVIELDVAKRRLKVGSEPVEFPPQEFALLRMLATALKHSWPDYGPHGAGRNHCGWIAIPDFENRSSQAFKVFFEYYRACFPGDPDQHYWNFKEDIERNLMSGTAEGRSYVKDRFKHLRRDVKERIEGGLASYSKQNRVLPRSKQVPACDGRRHFWRYGFPFEPHEIDIVESLPDKPRRHHGG